MTIELLASKFRNAAYVNIYTQYSKIDLDGFYMQMFIEGKRSSVSTNQITGPGRGKKKCHSKTLRTLSPFRTVNNTYINSVH